MSEIWLDGYEEDYYMDDPDYDENEELHWEMLFEQARKENR